jgi:hypothetical protein
MSYFSRIAKQSGIRFSGQDGNRPGTGAAQPDAQPVTPAPFVGPAGLAPLEREETLLTDPISRADKAENISGTQKQKFKDVSESAKSSETAGRRKKTAVKGAEISERREVSGRQEISVWEEISGRRETSVKSGKKEVFLSGRDEPEQGPRNVKVKTSESQRSPDSDIEKIAPAKKDVSKISGYEVSGQEISAREFLAQETPARPESGAKEIIRGEAGVEKRFFVKTADMIEQGNRNSAEAQNILLREVQEWAAAIPIEAESAEAAANEPAEVSGIAVKRNISQAEREPGVITIGAIGGERAGEMKRENGMDSSENGRIEEQSFELSIGTINVVIEGEERPQAQLAQPAADTRSGEKNVQQGAGGRSSRLSRSYL